MEKGLARTSLRGVETHRIELDRTDDGVVIVAVEGEHDIYTASALREQVDDAFRSGTAVVIDLSDATFLDSSILRALLAARNQAEEQASGFAVALDGSKAPAVQRIFEVTGLLEVFPVLLGRKHAVEAARGAARR
jgi:anti-sigma B factor antagonist